MPGDKQAFFPIFITFFLTRLALEIVGVLAVFYFPPASALAPARDLRFHKRQPVCAEIWARWDSEWYILIAEKGYSSYGFYKDAAGGRYMEQETAKFFPGYPLTIRLLNHVTRNSVFSGILSANAFLLLFLFYLHRLASLHLPKERAAFPAFLYLAFPTGFFLSATYSESMFLAALVAAFYYVETRQLVPAMAACAVAVVSRSPAAAALPALAWLAWRSFPQKRISAVLCVAASMLLPLLAYFAFIRHTFGSMQWIASTMAYWRGDIRYPLYAFVRFFQSHPAIHGQHNSMIDFSFAAAQLLVLILSFRRLSAPYVLYSAVAVLFPLSSTLFSFSRLALANVPFFLFLAGKLPERWIFPACLASAMLMAFFMAAFANWYWVG